MSEQGRTVPKIIWRYLKVCTCPKCADHRKSIAADPDPNLLLSLIHTGRADV